MPKAIQISASTSDRGVKLFALDSDGEVWLLAPPVGGVEPFWTKAPSIPFPKQRVVAKKVALNKVKPN